MFIISVRGRSPRPRRLSMASLCCFPIHLNPIKVQGPLLQMLTLPGPASRISTRRQIRLVRGGGRILWPAKLRMWPHWGLSGHGKLSVKAFHFLISTLVFKKRICLFLRERERERQEACEWGRSRERGRDREPQAGSVLSAQSPTRLRS